MCQTDNDAFYVSIKNTDFSIAPDLDMKPNENNQQLNENVFISCSFFSFSLTFNKVRQDTLQNKMRKCSKNYMQGHCCQFDLVSCLQCSLSYNCLLGCKTCKICKTWGFLLQICVLGVSIKSGLEFHLRVLLRQFVG